MTSNRERLVELDVLKGIMIFTIVLYHSPEYMRAFPNVLSVFYKYGGDIGNTLFFALSGFTLCYAYADRTETMELSNFIAKRIKSVYSIYLITDAAALCILILKNGISVLNVRDIVLNLLMITTGWVENIYPFNIPAWFFSALLLNYVIWFLISKYAKSKKWYVFAGMILFGLSIQKICLEKPFMYYHTGEAIVPFFEGCLLYRLWDARKQRGKSINPIICIFACITGICIYVTMAIDFDTAAGTWKYAWYGAFCPLIILSAISLKWIKTFLSSRPLQLIFGGISKYVFFWHYPLFSIVGGVLRKYLPAETKSFYLFGYLIALYFFCVLYRKVEQRFPMKKTAGI